MSKRAPLLELADLLRAIANRERSKYQTAWESFVQLEDALHEAASALGNAVDVQDELDRLKRDLALEQSHGEAIMAIRADLKERFGVSAAFFDDVIEQVIQQLQQRHRKAMKRLHVRVHKRWKAELMKAEVNDWAPADVFMQTAAHFNEVFKKAMAEEESR